MRSMLFVILFSISAALFAASKDGDSIVQSLIDKYGGNQIKNDHAQASGTLTYADGSGKSFTLTAKKRILRMELQSANENMAVVRRDGRSQITKGNKIEYPNRTPRSGSAINLLPIFALLEFSDDLRFASSVLRGNDGSISIQFVEGMPPGVKPPAFPQSKLIATFTLDSAGRISHAQYREEGGSARAFSYQYFYDANVAGPFLQPDKIIQTIDGNKVWTAIIDAARKQAAVPDNFFKILETRERRKSHE
jgi:hypothetical protein